MNAVNNGNELFHKQGSWLFFLDSRQASDKVTVEN